MKMTELMIRWVPTLLAFPIGGALAKIAFGGSGRHFLEIPIFPQFSGPVRVNVQLFGGQESARQMFTRALFQGDLSSGKSWGKIR